jgi:hypothetical protein
MNLGGRPGIAGRAPIQPPLDVPVRGKVLHALLLRRELPIL